MAVRKSGLGKGLGAIIPEEENFSSSDAGVNSVPVSKIIPNPWQPRYNIQENDLKELSDSIREHGILQPLIVTFDEEKEQYILIAGERRLRAAMLANLEFVPVIVRQATDQQRLEIALIENVQRADLTPLETAEAYRQLNEEFGLSHEDIATRVGKSRVAVTNSLRLLRLPEEVHHALAGGQITEGHARALLMLTSSQAQKAALATVITQELSVRKTEELARKLSGDRPVTVTQKTPDAELVEIEERLRTRLGTRVSLHHGKKGGSLVIHYYSDEELNTIINHIMRE